MKLTVKTLKGGKFTVEVEPSNTVGEAKGIIVSRRICSRPTDRPTGGRVLAKDDTMGTYAPVLEGLCSALHGFIYRSSLVEKWRFDSNYVLDA